MKHNSSDSILAILGRLAAFTALAFMFAIGRASAQDDVISRARAASSEGRRAEGLALLETHLVDSPRDVDARLTYGLMLSWDGQYDRARAELRRVLEAAPEYSDARVALMNVELMFVQTQSTSLVRIGIALVAEIMMLVV